MLDTDVVDAIKAEVVRLAGNELEQLMGVDPPHRVGRAPKMLLLFRSDDPARGKRVTRVFDLNGQKAQVEFLGAGQQVVVTGIHPDTKKPTCGLMTNPPSTCRLPI